jgi:hypothetical protein
VRRLEAEDLRTLPSPSSHPPSHKTNPEGVAGRRERKKGRVCRFPGSLFSS